MSVFQKCPYTNEECTYEMYSLSLGIPRFNTCDKCSMFTSKDEVKEYPQVGHKSDSEEIVELKKEKAKLECLLNVAKEIIRKYYKYNPSCKYSYEDIDKQAELFLKEDFYENILDMRVCGGDCYIYIANQ